MTHRLALTERPCQEASACAEPADAFDPLAPEVVSRLWRILGRLGVPKDSVPDAVQDSLVVLHRRQDSLRPGVAPSTWVYGVALRVASDYRRKVRRAGRLFEAVPEGRCELAASQGPSPFERLAQKEAAAVVQGILDTLVPGQREVFVLTELEELTLAEAAQALGISETTCKGRLRSARSAFNMAVQRERIRRARQEDL